MGGLTSKEAGVQGLGEQRIADEVIGRVTQRVLEGNRPVDEVINETLYHERRRLQRVKNAPRLDGDKTFIAALGHELPHAGDARQRAMVHEIVTHYAQEIRGHFDPRVYEVATKALPLTMTGLLNGLSPRRLLGDFGRLPSVDDRIRIEGEVPALLSLAKKGTVILAPTHSSNLDSPLVGYTIYRMGLPPFMYGAGLNLFSNPIISFFMHNLGAYTVDRLKTDPLYRETLKEYAIVSLEFGHHNLFFPGGTRSRSGAVESHLKKGLLGAGLAAYRNAHARGESNTRIFVVPCTVTYPLVLEASTLIDDWLSEEGKARYIIVDDEFSQWKRWLDFLRGLFELDLRVHVRIGQPLDVFGNPVSEDGVSHDPQGREMDPSRYLMADGKVVEDPVRDAEYTRMLASKLVDTYARDTVALPTAIVAFAFFELIRRESRHGDDLYRFLRTLGPETSLPQERLEREVERIVDELHALFARNEIRLSEEVILKDVRGIIRSALASFGTYHRTPVIERRGPRLHVGDAKLIFYYRNRLEGYGLLGAPRLVPGRSER